MTIFHANNSWNWFEFIIVAIFLIGYIKTLYKCIESTVDKHNILSVIVYYNKYIFKNSGISFSSSCLDNEIFLSLTHNATCKVGVFVSDQYDENDLIMKFIRRLKGDELIL